MTSRYSSASAIGITKRRADADHFAGQRAEQVNRPALVVAQVAGFDAGDRRPRRRTCCRRRRTRRPTPLLRRGCGRRRAARSACSRPASITCDSSLGLRQHVGRFVLVERGQHRGAGQRVGAPGVGAFAVVHVGEQIGPADRGARPARRCPGPCRAPRCRARRRSRVKANSEPVRPKLACTSSRMNRMSCSRQNRSSSCRYSFCGWYEPPPPRYGSVIRQQIRLPNSLARAVRVPLRTAPGRAAGGGARR